MMYDEEDYDEDNEADAKITILTNSDTDDEFRITKEEYIDCIYEYAITKRVIGFRYDW